MKTLHIQLEDRDYKKLIKIKGDRTWKKLLLTLANEFRFTEIKANG